MMPVTGGYDSYQGGFGPSFGAVGSGVRNIYFGASGIIMTATIPGRHAIAAAAGLALAPAFSPYPIDNLFQVGRPAKFLQQYPTGRTFVTTNRIGGIAAGAMVVYSLRNVSGKIYHGGKIIVESGVFTREGWAHVPIESNGGEDTSRTGNQKTRKSMRGRSAQRSLDKRSFASRRRKARSGPSSKRRPAGTPKGKATKKRSFSRRGRPAPWCYRHNRRHFCQFTRKR